MPEYPTYAEIGSTEGVLGEGEGRHVEMGVLNSVPYDCPVMRSSKSAQ